MLNKNFVFLLIAVSTLSCFKSGYQESIVYNSNFNSGDTSHLTGAILWNWNNQTIVGRYNKGGFSLNLNNLPPHNALEITVIPYFHDSWDGSDNVGGINGPDIWQMQVDGSNLVHATFSNSPCVPLYCLQQSYPLDYGLINNPPMTDAVQTLPGVGNCSGIYTTSVYRIVRTISHSSSTVSLSFRDFLVQTNVPDQLCDESWSMAGIIVKAINTH